MWVNIDEIETNESSYESHSRVCSTHYTLNTYTILQYMTIESATPPPVRLHNLVGMRLKYPSIPCVAVIILNISESDSTHTLERASNYLSLSLSHTTFSFFFFGDVIFLLRQSAWGPHNGQRRGKGGGAQGIRQKDFMSIFRASKLFIY